jgi:iron complex outermembrane recepter protein
MKRSGTGSARQSASRTSAPGRAPPAARRVAVWVAAAFAAQNAAAQEAATSDAAMLEEIIVTARKTSENIQDTPVAVTALTAAALEERAVVNISEIAAYTPSLRFDPVAAISGSSNSATVFIRGVGQTDFNLTIDPGVGIYLDGVYISRSVGALLDTADVERIEVLRGPQGTLFGKNTIGGAIAITSRRPADELSFDAELATGSLDRADLRLTADVPLSDAWRVHVAGAMFKRDGYVDRLWDGDDSSDRDNFTGRLVSEWTPAPDVTLTLAFDGTRAREATVGATALRIYEVNPSPATIPVHFPTISNLLLNGASCAPPNPDRLSNPACYNEQWLTGDPYKTWAAGSNRSDSDVWGAAFTVELPLGPMRFKSISAYRELDTEFDLDTDISPVALVNTANDYTQEQVSQEFQLTGDAGDRLRWLLGLYYLGEEGTDVNSLTTVLTSFRSGGTVDNDSYAAFGQLVWRLADRTSLTLGGRFTSETKRFSPDQVILSTLPVPLPFAPGDRVLPLGEVSAESDEFTPSVSLDFKPTDSIMTYVSYAKGFKSGGFTQRIFPPEPETPSFEPEFVETWEAGLKTELLERRLRWNSAVFYSDYTDQQVIVIDGFAPKVRNAGDSRIWGVESEFEAVAGSRLRVNGSLSYLNAEYTSIDPRATPVNIDSMLVNTPEWMGSLGLTGVLWVNGSGELSTRWDWFASSELAKDSENTPELIQGSYDTLNGSVTYARADGRWALTAGGTNLTDEDYLVSGNYNPAIGAVYGVYGRPREWYVRLTLDF